MFIINFTKLIKIWKNLKNRVISINKLEPEKDDDVEITIKGKFKKEEEDMSKPPKWFKEFENKINQKITKSNEDVKKQITKLKEDVKTQITKSNENVETKINQKITKSNENVKTQITKLKEDVKTQITKLKEDVETKINQKITKLKEDVKTQITKSNENVKTQITKLKEYFDTKIPKWFKDWNEKIFIPFKDKVEKEIINIKKDIAAMKNTPTMKKELGLN